MILLGVSVAAASAQQTIGINDVVRGVYERDSTFRAEVTDLTMSSVSFVRKLNGDGGVKEEKKFIKKYYFKDGLFKTEFLEYYKDGELQNEKELAKAVKEAKERRAKGRNRDASVNPLEVFSPATRDDYIYNLVGIETMNGYPCYHVTAACGMEDENMLEGDFWIDTTGFNPVLARFHPSKLPGPIKQMDFEMAYEPVVDGWWLPVSLKMRGRGKVMVFIKFNFSLEETYTDHTINSGLSDAFFQETDDEK